MKQFLHKSTYLIYISNQCNETVQWCSLNSILIKNLSKVYFVFCSLSINVLVGWAQTNCEVVLVASQLWDSPSTDPTRLTHTGSSGDSTSTVWLYSLSSMHTGDTGLPYTPYILSSKHPVLFLISRSDSSLVYSCSSTLSRLVTQDTLN